MAMAMRDSVTVSMSAEMTGMLSCRSLGQHGVQLRVPGQDFGVERGEGEVVERERDFGIGREKFVRRKVELGVNTVLRYCHVGRCMTRRGLGKSKPAAIGPSRT